MTLSKIAIALLIFLIKILSLNANLLDLSFNQNRFWIPSTNSSNVEVQIKLKVLNISDYIEATSKLPFEMTIVLDRSGSMAGSKIENCKKSIKNIIKKLKANDKLNVITYDDESQIMINKGVSSNKEELLDIISSIEVGYNTNLYSGLFSGIKVSQRSDNFNKNKRIFLFSDGLVNTGITDHEKIQELVRSSEIIINSYGVGTDYDNVLMENIAKEGKGEFFFIDSPESIEKVVSITTNAFVDLIGTDAQINFFCPPGIELKKIYGIEKIINGFRIGDLRRSDLLSFFTEFSVDPKFFVNEQLECFYTLTYQNKNEQEEIMKGSFLKLKITEDEEKIKAKDIEVEKMFELQQSVENQQHVKAFLEKNDVKSALEILDEEFNKMKDLSMFLIDVENKRIAETAIKRVKKLKEKTKANPYDKKGNIYSTQQSIYLGRTNSKTYEDL